MRALLDPDNETKATCVIGKDEVIQGRINSVAKFRRCVSWVKLRLEKLWAQNIFIDFLAE